MMVPNGGSDGGQGLGDGSGVAVHDLVDGRLGIFVLVGQAFNRAFSGVTSTLIRWGLAVSAFGSVTVSTPRL